MGWLFDPTRPIYTQLVERIKMMIGTGELANGGKLPSVRDLAQEAGVNPNTMQRALVELEREGLIYTQRTSGRFVTDDVQRIEIMRQQVANEKIEQFITSVQQLGFSKAEVLQSIQNYLEGMK